jgi:hypothetical protein
MSVELSIFKVFCQDREKHLAHKGHVEGLNNLEKELKTLFNLLTTYYDEYEGEDSVSPGILLDYYELKFPKSKGKDDITTIVTNAFDIELNEDMVDGFLDQLNEKYVATTLVNKLMPVLEGEKYGIVAGLAGNIDNYIELMHNPPDNLAVPEPCELGIRELIKKEIHEPGIPWRLPYLTHKVGGLRPATLGLIFAFVDSGKTSFCLDNVAAWSDYLEEGETICYAGNEEAAGRLKLRGAQAWLKQRVDWLRDNEREAEVMLSRTKFNSVKFFDDIVSGDQVKYILKTYRPRVLVVDQATDVDIHTKRKADGVEYLKQLFKWYRRLANEYQCAIVGVSQGVGDAENTKWLKLSDIYGSRVAIQGALDYAIGIGRKVDDAAAENQRYINIPKNKLNGGEGGKVTTNFVKQLCLWKEA